MGEVVLLAIGLALDCTAVAAATAVAAVRVRLRDALKMATIFGGMQALLGSIGWIGGVGVTRFIAAWDHWVAFGLLTFIGGKMILEGAGDEEELEEAAAPSFRLSRLVLLGLATSIDSAAVGITLPLLEFPIGLAIAIIGITSFVFTIAALYLADRIAGRFSERLEIIGGVVLVAIGVKILVEHLRG